MRGAFRWLRSICLVAMVGLLACLQPAWAEPDLLPPQDAAPPATQSQHGGGGFAPLLLDYRLVLERLTEDLRERTAELAAGVDMVPAEMRGALQRVTAGADPVLLMAGLLVVLASGLLARHAVRWRLAGERLEGSSDRAARFGSRVGARSIGLWSISWRSALSPWWRSDWAPSSCRAPGRRARSS